MPLTVIQFAESFSPLSETFVYDTVVGLREEGIACPVLTLNRERAEERPCEDVHVVPWPGRWEASRLWYRALSGVGIGDRDVHEWPVVRRRLRRRLERLRPDVVHAQFGPMGALMAPVADEMGIPLVVTFHGYDVSSHPRRRGVARRYADLFRRAALLVSNSSHNARKLTALGAAPDRVRVLHNGSRLDDLPVTDPAGRLDGREVRLLFVGRLVPVKAPVDLLRAFRISRDALADELTLRLTIAGAGPEEATARSYAAAHGLEEAVTFLGAVPHRTVRELLGTHHLYVQHCRKTAAGDEEGLGMSLIEAQASGLPVVSTRSGGIPEAVADGRSGYLVAEGDVEAMARHIVELARHPERWRSLGEAGRRHVEERFELRRRVRELVQLYEGVLE